jgi:uncharacterized membrane protein
MQNLFKPVIDFLAANDFPTLMESIRQLQWSDVLKSIYTWLIFIPPLTAIVWTKRFKFLLTLASLVIFVVLLQYTLPPPDKKIMLDDLVEFLGGTFVLVATNIYFLIIRE